jgi:hypothetical protein
MESKMTKAFSAQSKLVSTTDLTATERRLVDALRELGYGRIKALRILHGQPLLDPWPLTIRDVRFDSSNFQKVQTAGIEFDLKAPVVELVRHIRSLESGEILSLAIRHGLPAGMELVVADEKSIGSESHE